MSIQSESKKRLKTGYGDFLVTTLEKPAHSKKCRAQEENVSVGLVGNCAM